MSQPIASEINSSSHIAEDAMAEKFTSLAPMDEDSSDEKDEDSEDYDKAVIPSGLDRPNDWVGGSFAALTKIVHRAKGAASKPVIHFIKKYLRGTKLILVVGQAGTGKTTLLNELTGQDMQIGKSHKSGTKGHQVCPAVIEGEQYIFIDTAGFGAADIDDLENFHDIVTCLDALSPFVTFAGLLFVYGGNQSRMMKHDLSTIQWVKCFCGPEFYQFITFVTTKWDYMNEDDFEQSWEENLPLLLEEECIKDLLDPSPVGQCRYHGGAVYHHSIKGGIGEKSAESTQRLSRRKHADERAKEVQAMVHSRYKNASKIKPQISRELALKVPWRETEAAAVLQNNPMYVDLHIKDHFARVSLRDTPIIIGEHSGQSNSANSAPDQSENMAQQFPTQERHAKSGGGTKPERHFRPKKSWTEILFPWIDVAKEAAWYFMSNKRKQKQATGQGQGPAWARIRDTLQNWWSGEAPDDLPSE